MSPTTDPARQSAALTAMLGIRHPVFQGPFGGGISSAELVAAVSNAGGLGGYGAYHLPPEEIGGVADLIRRLTDRPFNLNLWVSDADDHGQDWLDGGGYDRWRAAFQPFFDRWGAPLPDPPERAPVRRFEQQAEAVLRLRPAVFSFVFGIPDPAILAECRRQGIVTIGAATTLDEGLALETAGVDVVVASGFEAGGHRPSFLRSAEDSLHGTFVLTGLLTAALRTPVVAAGGIADARGVRAALALGAAGVQVGTAFLVCDESNASEAHKQVILSESGRRSTLTKAFTGRLARGTQGRLAEVAGAFPRDAIAPLPLQNIWMAPLRQRAPEDWLTFWCGQGAPLVRRMAAEALMKGLVEGLE